MDVLDLLSPSFWTQIVAERGPDEQEERDGRVLRVSELSGCLRHSYLMRTSPARPSDSSILAMFYGRAVHGLLGSLLSGHEGFEVEVPVEYHFEGITVVGRVDAIYDNVPVEFKTAGEVPDEPRLPDAAQLRYYASIMGADRGVLVYLSRDRIRAFRVGVDRRVAIGELERRARLLRRCLERREAPRPEPERARAGCHACPYFISGRCDPRRAPAPERSPSSLSGP